METFYIILAQSVTGAVVTIVLLLLVSAVIGYLTAWFYAKSVYKPIIKGLEEENSGLKKQVTRLKDDIFDLNKKIDHLNEKVGSLEKEIEEKNLEIKEHNNTRI